MCDEGMQDVEGDAAKRQRGQGGDGGRGVGRGVADVIAGQAHDGFAVEFLVAGRNLEPVGDDVALQAQGVIRDISRACRTSTAC